MNFSHLTHAVPHATCDCVGYINGRVIVLAHVIRVITHAPAHIHAIINGMHMPILNPLCMHVSILFHSFVDHITVIVHRKPYFTHMNYMVTYYLSFLNVIVTLNLHK